jgi:hypothetical protein
VRWEDLFADLERQWDGLADAGRQAEIAERTRAEFARVGLVERLRGSEGRRVRLLARGGHEVAGELSRVGADFVLVTAGRAECLLPLDAVAAVGGLGPESVPAEVAGAVRARLGLGSVLRRVAADRSAVTVVVLDPPGRALSGRVQRVGADFLELAEPAPGEPPHPGGGGRVTLVPFAALVLLRRDAPDRQS